MTLLILLTGLQLTSALHKQPNIVFIVADDLGYNDVSWHNPDIHTPHLARLAKEGVVLEQSYVQPICTPTRSALMTGLYPIHTGRQHAVIRPQEPVGLHVNLTILPEHLKKLGYNTHMVGKWHLGYCNKDYLPTSRGFDSQYGYYLGAEDYYQHTRGSSTKPHIEGYDFRCDETVAREATGNYSAHLFATRAVQLIRQQENSVTPLFLYLAFQSVHAPLQVPAEYERPYKNISNKARRTFSGMVSALDEAVGNVTKALRETGLMDDTLIVFTTDNGGQTKNGGNNFPLRGNKNTLWEGGTRGAAFIHGGLLNRRGGSVSRQLIHVTDWLPTLVSAAGGTPSKLGPIDGVDQWPALMSGGHPRKLMLYNIDPLKGDGGPNGAVRLGPFKLIRGDPGSPSGWIPPYHVVDEEEDETDITEDSSELEPSKLLFNLDNDPTEREDLSTLFPSVVTLLEGILDRFTLGMVPPHIKAEMKEANPANFQGAWSTGWCNTSLDQDILSVIKANKK